MDFPERTKKENALLPFSYIGIEKIKPVVLTHLKINFFFNYNQPKPTPIIEPIIELKIETTYPPKKTMDRFTMKLMSKNKAHPFFKYKCLTIKQSGMGSI